MKDFIYQTHQKECGYACLKMLLSIIHKDKNYLYLPTSKKEFTLFSLKEIAKQHNTYLGGYIYKNENEIIKERKPFIMVKKVNENDSHAILVRYINKFISYVYDPDLGKKIYLTTKLLKNIDEGITILKIEDYQKRASYYQFDPLITNLENALLLGLEILTIFSYFLGAYFINKNNHILLSIIFIVAGVVLAISYKHFTYKIMEKFDDKYLIYTYDLDPQIRRHNYTLMHNVKSNLFYSTYQILLSLTSALAVNTILILDNYYIIYIFLTSILLSLVKIFFSSKVIKENSYKIEKEENYILDKKEISLEEYQNAYKDIKMTTYSVAKKLDLKKIVSYFVLLIVTITLCALNNSLNLYSILFYFALGLFTYNSFEQVFTLSLKNKDHIINLTKFYQLINKTI